MALRKKGAWDQGPTEEHGGAGAKEDGDDAELRLILVGKSGGGKSATGNTILGQPAFESHLTAKAMTVECQRAQGMWNGKTISVLDTPALFDAEKMERPLAEQLESCRRMCRAGLHAFILVTQVGRFTAEDAAAAKRVWKLFGDKSACRTIVLFTCKEDLGGDDLQTYVSEAKNKQLRELMEECKGRLCGFNNKAKGDERDEQVDQLMRMVEKIAAENHREPYFIPEGDDAELRLILVGKSGCGKSATGNTILGQPAFESHLTAKAMTVKCQRAQGMWNGKTISVLDTPALFDAEKMERPLAEQLESCRRMCRTGLHAFILVTHVGCFTAEDAAAAKRVWKLFGDKSACRTIVLFTCKEDLGGDDLQTYVSEAKNKQLRELMEECNGRLCGFNNKAKGDERDEQVDQLMRMVEGIAAENHGEPYFIPEGDDAKLRLILVGKSGGGKSATGNTILGQPAFESHLAAKAMTVECQRAQGMWNGKTISVLDTPALFDAEKLERPLAEQLESCRRMCRTGLHAFILVTQVGRFTAEDAAAAKRVWKLFGDESACRTIVLFTCKEDLGGDDLQTYVSEAKNKQLRELMEECKGRLCGFNNKAKGDERDEQVDQLMRMVEEIAAKNHGEPYFIPEGPEKFKLFSKVSWKKKKWKSKS